MSSEAIIHRWYVATGIHSKFLQADKTAMEEATSWLEENEDQLRILIIY